jgi:hypothetical protein
VPLFAARCSTNLNIDCDTDGQVYVNGEVAKLIKRPDGQITAIAGGVYIDITPQGSQPPPVTYTAKDKSTGTCEILSFKAAGATSTPDTDTSSTAVVPAAPDDGGPRNWEVASTLNLREQPSTSARILAQYGPGTILDNLGYQRVQGLIWCDVQQLGGGPRGYVSADYLRPAVSPDGSVATGPDDSALRAGQGMFDANGSLPCALSEGQPMGECEFGVARSGGGYATVVIKKPDGRTRALFFRMGRPIGADVSESEGRLEFRATKEGDLHLIRIGNERYEIWDAIILGG